MAFCTLHCESSAGRDPNTHPLVKREWTTHDVSTAAKTPDAPHIGDKRIANIRLPEDSDQSEKASAFKSSLCLVF